MRKLNPEGLKYYLRGIGIGMILAALILIITDNPEGKQTSPMTDAQIKERALELGMVEINTLDDLRKLNESGEQAGETSERKEASQASGVPDVAESSQGTDTSEAVETPQGADTSEVIEGASSGENREPGLFVTVKKGDTSTRVAGRLKARGLIDDVKAFDRFLYEGGYDRRILVGTYEIQPGTDWEEIARILTWDNRTDNSGKGELAVDEKGE